MIIPLSFFKGLVMTHESLRRLGIGKVVYALFEYLSSYLTRSKRFRVKGAQSFRESICENINENRITE